MSIITNGESSVDVGRLSVKAVVVMGLVVAVVAWVLSAAAAYTGVQLALADMRNQQGRAEDRAINLKEAADELKKRVTLSEIDIRDNEKRTTLLEAAVKTLEKTASTAK